MTTPTPPQPQPAIETLKQRLIDAGCEGDDEQGCTRDDAIVPLEQWCINCLAGHAVAQLTAETQARQEAERVTSEWQLLSVRAVDDLTAEREARQTAEARATYEIWAMNEVMQQAERERDETLQRVERQRKAFIDGDTVVASLRAQLTASERSRAQSETERNSAQLSLGHQQQRAEAAETTREALRTALESLNLQPGYDFCCCDMAIGDNGATEHHETCLMARAALSAVQAREPRPATDPEPERVDKAFYAWALTGALNQKDTPKTIAKAAFLAGAEWAKR